MNLEERLGYTFVDRNLLRLALTHRSVGADDPTADTGSDNERLEFLGDAVLQLVVTDALYADYPDLAEGQLAKTRAAVVSRPTLSEIAREMDLGRYVELSITEERSGGRSKDSIIGDALEALLGAIYLDGGLEAASKVVVALWADRIAERAKSPGVKDYKTRLQETLARDGERPEYQLEGTGPDHNRRFTARVMIGGALAGTGEGRSKKEAEQDAARQALRTLAGG